MSSDKAIEYMERIDRVLGEETDPAEKPGSNDVSTVLALLCYLSQIDVLETQET